MPHSDSIAKLAAALCQAQKSMQPAKKDTENPFFKSKYADLANVWEAIREPLTTNGLSITQLPVGGTDGEVNLVTMLLHSSGEWVASDFIMKPTKSDPQAIGSCLTYARRYALAAITGVAAEDDDDGQAASQPTQQKAVQVGLMPKPVPPVKPVKPMAEQFTTENGFVWRIGKDHKGQRLEDIETGYLEWYRENGTLQDHRAAAIMELDRRTGQEIFAPEHVSEVDEY